MCFYIIYAFLIGVSLMNTSLTRAILGPWMDGETEPLIYKDFPEQKRGQSDTSLQDTTDHTQPPPPRACTMQDETHTKTVLRDTALKKRGLTSSFTNKRCIAQPQRRSPTESRPGKTKGRLPHHPPPAGQTPKILHSSNFAPDLRSTSVTRKPKAAPRNTGTNRPVTRRPQEITAVTTGMTRWKAAHSQRSWEQSRS